MRGASKVRQLAAAVVGNLLEWYDFIVFGLVTVVISRLFFPTGSQYASLLLTAATFGVGFCMRPVGGILLGIYANRKGRKAALLLIIGLMTLAIGMIAFSPTYAAIGIAAPLCVLLARLLQGFATGGEFSCATTFLLEIAPAQHPRLRHQRREARHQIQRLEHDVGGAIPVRRLERLSRSERDRRTDEYDPQGHDELRF
jgi:MFS family permease